MIVGIPGPGLPGPAGGAPPASQINMGMVQGAVYDAVNAITPKHFRPYLLKRRFGNTASDEAAVATAAYLVLKNIVETVPQSITFPNRATLLASLASRCPTATNAIPDSPFKNMGVAAGTAAAEAMIDARQGDGRFGPSQFVPNASPGFFDPVAPNGTTALDPTPWVGGVEPFLMQSSSQFRSAGPLALTSAAYAAEFNEVKALGGDGVVTPSARTATQTCIAKWWQSNPVASWNDVARQLIARNGLDAMESARLLAMQNLAAADAAINDWNDKCHFSFWRPFQAIRRAAEDGNAATSPDPPGTLVDAAALSALSRPCVGTSRPRRLAHRRAADVLRRCPRGRLPDHKRFRESRRGCDANVHQLLAGARRACPGAHLGWPPLPHRGRAGPAARSRHRELRSRELLPTRGQPLTCKQCRPGGYDEKARSGRAFSMSRPARAAPERCCAYQ